MLQPVDVQYAALGVHLAQLEPAPFRDAQAMPEKTQKQAAITGFVTCACRRSEQPFDFAGGKVQTFAITVLNHFVEGLPSEGS
jgi:hypothetical protein